MLEESIVRVNTAEKGGKGLRVLGKGERIRFYFLFIPPLTLSCEDLNPSLPCWPPIS